MGQGIGEVTGGIGGGKFIDDVGEGCGVMLRFVFVSSTEFLEGLVEVSAVITL